MGFSVSKYLLISPAILALILHGVSATLDSRTCYDYNNTALPDQRPCYSPGTKSVSHCCSTVDTCVADTLCLSQFGTLYIGSCTVKDWGSGSAGRGDCPKYYSYCTVDAGWDIALCNYTNSGWEYCCGALQGINECCSHDRFRITNTTNEFLNQRQWENDTATTSATLTSASSAGTATGATCDASDSGNKRAEIGIGLGLGIPLLMALGLLFWENKKRRNTEAALGQQESSEVHVQQRQEYNVVPIYEASDMKHKREELPSSHPVHELHQ